MFSVRAPVPGVGTAKTKRFSITDAESTSMVLLSYSGIVTHVFRVLMLVFSFSSEYSPVSTAALRALEGTQGWIACSLNDFLPLEFLDSAMNGEIVFRSLINGTGVLELMLTGFDWSGRGIVSTSTPAVASPHFCSDCDSPSGEASRVPAGTGKDESRRRSGHVDNEA